MASLAIAGAAGEEVLADFGYDWFNRVQDASHKAIARELLDYRTGAKAGACQVRGVLEPLLPCILHCSLHFHLLISSLLSMCWLSLRYRL